MISNHTGHKNTFAFNNLVQLEIYRARFIIISFFLVVTVGGMECFSQNIYSFMGYTVNGSGQGYNSNGGAATSARITGPQGIAVDAAGKVYVAEFSNNRIRTITTAGKIGTAAGTCDGNTTSLGDGGAATDAHFNKPMDVALDAAGNIYIVEHNGTGSSCNIRKVTVSTGIITTIAGTGAAASSNDGGLATAASLNNPDGVAIDASNNVYIADVRSSRIRKITVSTGIISTVAGTKDVFGFSGDGGLATACQLNRPYGVEVDAAGNIYIADQTNNRIRKVTAATGNITTIAGNGTAGYTGDGGAATAANLNLPSNIAVDASGNIYISDQNNFCIRKVTVATGIITTVAGTGAAGYNGDGIAATTAQLNFNTGTSGSSQNVICGVALDAAGNIYIGDRLNRRVRKVTVATGLISTIGGNGVAGSIAEGARAPDHQLDFAKAVAVDASGNIYVISNAGNEVVWKVTAGIVSVAAGTGTPGYSGDGGLARSADIRVDGIAVDASGNLFISGGDCIRRVDASTTNITTIAGTGSGGYTGDNGPATSATLYTPVGNIAGIATDPAGNVYFTQYTASAASSCVRKINVSTGIITTVAGTGTAGYNGDGIAATAAQLNEPRGLAVDANSNIYIVDGLNYRIRKVTVATGLISTIAGTGTFGCTGDGGLATAAKVNYPEGISVDASGNVFIADAQCAVIRKITVASGIINVVAGNGTTGFSGDGGLATSAQLNTPTGISIAGNGNCLFIADWSNSRIRVVDFGGSCMAVLPVTVLAFHAQCIPGGVKCTWSTGSEQNNDFFVVQRSLDGKTWTDGGNVKGAGNSSTINNYEYIDDAVEPVSGSAIFYYRLKQTDFDGKYEYFGPVSVSCAAEDEWRLIVETFISNSSVHGTLFAPKDAELILNVADLQGKIVKQQKINAFKGSNYLSIEFPDVAAGMYFISLQNARVNLWQKIIKN